MSVNRASAPSRRSPLSGDEGAHRAPRAAGPRMLRYLDITVPVLAAPILLPVGVPVVGYALGTVAWILVRTLGVAVDRYASSIVNVVQQASLRLTYRFLRVFLLAGAAVLALKSEGRSDGLSALLVITFAFTLHLSRSIINRPRYRL